MSDMRGMTLIELVVALSLTSVVILGSITMYEIHQGKSHSQSVSSDIFNQTILGINQLHKDLQSAYTVEVNAGNIVLTTQKYLSGNFVEVDIRYIFQNCNLPPFGATPCLTRTQIIGGGTPSSVNYYFVRNVQWCAHHTNNGGAVVGNACNTVPGHDGNPWTLLPGKSFTNNAVGSRGNRLIMSLEYVPPGATESDINNRYQRISKIFHLKNVGVEEPVIF